MTILPRVVTLGFFSDGVLYAAIARNMAEGLGSFWAPHYTSGFGEIFYEHPPLSFWLHSLFYRTFGDLPLLDKLYGMFCGAGVLYLTAAIFRKISPERESWSPMLFLLAMPMFTWAFANNLLENLMTLCAVAAVYFQCRAFEMRKGAPAYFFSGALLAAGVLAKNPAVIFPLAFPFFYWLILQNGSFSRVILHTVIVSAGLSLTLALLIFPSGGETFFKEYIDAQLVTSLTGQREGETPGILPLQFIMEFLTATAIAGLIWLFFRKKRAPQFTREGFLFLVIGLSATLPLILIPKQRTYYLLPGLPFIAMAVASFFGPVMNELELWYKNHIDQPLRQKKEMLAKIPLALLLAGAIMLNVPFQGKPARMLDFFNDLYPLAEKVSQQPRDHQPILLCHPTLSKDYSLISHIERYLKLDPVRRTNKSGNPLEKSKTTQKNYWILRDKNKRCTLPPGCSEITLQKTRQYSIFNCRIDHDKK